MRKNVLLADQIVSLTKITQCIATASVNLF